LQISATCKHFAAYSLEAADSYTRNSFNAEVSERQASPPPLLCFLSLIGTKLGRGEDRAMGDPILHENCGNRSRERCFQICSAFLCDYFGCRLESDLRGSRKNSRCKCCRDMEASYTPAFKACIEAGARSVMCSYNAVNGKPSCANPQLLQQLLRDK